MSGRYLSVWPLGGLDRHGRGSILITSQLPVATWHEVIGEPTLDDAILDRLVHNAYRLELDGPSMRKIKAAGAACDTNCRWQTTEGS
jgi:IstB-like ATP binding protein